MKKIAGHVIGGRLHLHHECIVMYGRMLKDERGTDHHGDTRDFSGRNIQTSWVEGLAYVPAADTTVVYTKNSIYYTPGNLILDQLKLPETEVDGKRVLFERLKEVLEEAGLKH